MDKNIDQLLEELDDLHRQVAQLKSAEEERRYQEAQRRVLEQLRQMVWKMSRPDDIERIVVGIRSGLEELGISFRYCSINILESEDGASPQFHAYTTEGEKRHIVGKGAELLERFWRGKEVVLRRDLAEENPFGENFRVDVRSVVDIPFARGTLGISSLVPDAFSEQDIVFFKELAQLLDEGFRRMEDLLTLERRNKELEAEISARQRMEQDLIRLERLGALEDLASGVSHNLNNILTGVLLPAELLQISIDDPQLREEVDQIVSSARHARDVVQRLSRSVRGERQERPYPVQVEEVVQEAVETVRPRWKDEAEARGVAIEVVTRIEELPLIRGTRLGLHDIIVNMLLNAVEAMPEGGTIVVRARVQPLDDRTGEAEMLLSVTDEGVGMDEATRQRVFEPFFTTKATVDAGLGLSTAYGTVTAWGGKIEVESALEKGATFTVRLPIWSEAGELVFTEEALQEQRRRILIVEDDEVVSRVMSRLLEKEYEVEVADDGQEALDGFVPGYFDVVFVDLGLPTIPGDQVVEEMRRRDPELVAVLITGWGLQEDDPRLQKFDFQLQKPFHLQQVKNAAVLVLEQRDRKLG